MRASRFRLLSRCFRCAYWWRPRSSASTQRPPWTLAGAQLVEQTNRVLAPVAREVAVVAVDHGHARAHVAGGQRWRCRHGVRRWRTYAADRRSAQRLDPGRELRRLPLTVAEVVQVEVAAPLGGEHECAQPTRWLLFDRLEPNRLQRHRAAGRRCAHGRSITTSPSSSSTSNTTKVSATSRWPCRSRSQTSGKYGTPSANATSSPSKTPSAGKSASSGRSAVMSQPRRASAPEVAVARDQ